MALSQELELVRVLKGALPTTRQAADSGKPTLISPIKSLHFGHRLRYSALQISR